MADNSCYINYWVCLLQVQEREMFLIFLINYKIRRFIYKLIYYKYQLI